MAPVYYAHLAAQQMGQLIKFEDSSKTSSGHKSSITSAGRILAPELPGLNQRLQVPCSFAEAHDSNFKDHQYRI